MIDVECEDTFCIPGRHETEHCTVLASDGILYTKMTSSAALNI